MKDKIQEKIETIHYILTFACFILILICFATPIFTGKAALVRFDSLSGSLLLGIIFVLYCGWIIYNDMLIRAQTLSQAAALNLKKNATFISVILYWLILIIFPLFCNIL